MIKEKNYQYNEVRTKLISYIILIIFIPINIYLYNSGFYGEAVIDLGFFGKVFLKELKYDIPFIIIILGLIIKFARDLKNVKTEMVYVNKKDKILAYGLFLAVSLILIAIYFLFNEFTSIATFLGMFILVFIASYESIKEITKKEIEVE